MHSSLDNIIFPFATQEIIYEDENFAIGFGKDKNSGGELAVGMRWLNTPNELGYPNAHGEPRWFIVPDCISIELLKMLVCKCDDKTKLVKIIKQLQEK